MSIDIVTMEDCASNYGVFKVPGSKPGTEYTVTLHGSEGPAHCTCEGFRWSGELGQLRDLKSCKHIKQVYDQACLYNPQWHDSNENPKLKPVSYTYDHFSRSKCACGGPMVYVRRAV